MRTPRPWSCELGRSPSAMANDTNSLIKGGSKSQLFSVIVAYMVHVRIILPCAVMLHVHECNIPDADGVRETMADEDYLSVRLPKELMSEIDRLVSRKAFGFRSRAEFIADAVRRRLEEISGLERIATRRK